MAEIRQGVRIDGGCDPRAAVSSLARQAREHLGRGDYAAAERVCLALLDLDPGHAPTLERLGVLAQQQGRSDAALAFLARAAAADPRNARIAFNLAVALEACGEVERAAERYEEAVLLDPAKVGAWLNLGNLRVRQDKLEAGAACYRQALKAQPSYAEAHNNLARVLERQGKASEALAHYSRALAERPDHREANLNLAALHVARGEHAVALVHLLRALAGRETADAKALFVQCMENLPGQELPNEIRDWLVAAISEPWGRPRVLADAAAHLLHRQGPIASACRSLQQRSGAADAAALFEAMAGDPLLLALLRAAPICDVALERLLAALRFVLLQEAAASRAPVSPKGLTFFGALAQQCAINEYVFSATEAELDAVGRLRQEIEHALAADRPVAPACLLAVACYLPLHALTGCIRLFEREWPDPIRDVLMQQIEEPAEEARLASGITCLAAPKDATSLEVQQQYEENPYPRWVKAAPIISSGTVENWLARTYPAADATLFAGRAEADILVAGCGTGQQSIETARRFVGARVLAVDLSLKSLGYAWRKARELRLDAIVHVQADILQLAELDKSFDIIEASGVLHHLAVPMAGWRVLASLLRPGGLMCVGLYSERARRSVVAGRRFIARGGYRRTQADIRRCRQDILASSEPALRELAKFRDFYALSECRDLLFHVEEHRFTLPQIAAALSELGLNFLGFVLPEEVLRRYRLRFPQDPALTTLSYWHEFETEQPETFSAMYQFWVQKRKGE